MMGLYQRISLQQAAARVAAKQDKRPYVFYDENDVTEWAEGLVGPMPNVGSHVPNGWHVLCEPDTCRQVSVTVSKGGFDGGPALSIKGLSEWIKRLIKSSDATIGFAIVKEGEFQVVVGAFIKD